MNNSTNDATGQPWTRCKWCGRPDHGSIPCERAAPPAAQHGPHEKHSAVGGEQPALLAAGSRSSPTAVPSTTEEKAVTHIDDWIDRPVDSDHPDAYAMFFFWLKRYPAWAQYAFEPWTKQFKLFCTYEGKRYRVTGCSRLGDVWLATNPDRETGYDKRVEVTACSEWSNKP